MLFTTILATVCSAPAPADWEEELAALLAEATLAEEPAERERLARKAAELTEDQPLERRLAALRAGPTRTREAPPARGDEEIQRFGRVLTGYRFEADGHTYGYAVDLPDDYDGRRPCGVLVDPGHGSGSRSDAEGKAGFLEMYRRHVDEAGLSGWIVARTEVLEQVGGDGLRGRLPEEEVARVFDAFFRDLTVRFAVDLDRVYVAGISQSAYWAWYLGQTRADRLAGIAPASAVTWQSDPYLDNLRHLPAYVLHGSDDAKCPPSQPRATCAELLALGGDVVYAEVSGAAHDYGVWGRMPEAYAWLAERPRGALPRSVGKSLQTLADPWTAWLRVDELKREGDGKAGGRPRGGVDAEWEGQEVRLFSDGVEAVTLAVSPELCDLEQPLTVHWNGREVFSGRVEPSFEAAFRLAAERADWGRPFAAELRLKAP